MVQDYTKLENPPNYTNLAPNSSIKIPNPFSIGNSPDEDVDSDSEDEEEKYAIKGENQDRYSNKEAHIRRRKLLWSIPAFSVILILVILISTFTLSRIFHTGKHMHRFLGEGLKKVEFSNLEDVTFRADRKRLNWLAEAGDGVYSRRTPTGGIELTNVNLDTTRMLVEGESILDESGQKLDWVSFSVSSDMKYVLFTTDTVQQWRHSSHSNYYIYTIATGLTNPLLPPTIPPRIAIASFSKGHHIAYVLDNDLYVLEAPMEGKGHGEKAAVRITKDGGATLFNGVPDWVYEEEVVATDTTSYWNPTGSMLAYLTFDEAKVPEYEFPIYNPHSYVNSESTPYPTEVVMRYPKPGFPNPLVYINLFDVDGYFKSPSTKKFDDKVAQHSYKLQFEKRFDPKDEIIMEVAWIGEFDLMIKATDRIARQMRVAHFNLRDLDTSKENVIGKVVREVDYRAKDAGWVEASQSIARIEGVSDSYLDIVPDSTGHNHIALFHRNDDNPIFLTSGPFEIDGSITVDAVRNKVYALAAAPSIERHLYSIDLPDLNKLDSFVRQEPKVLTDTTQKGMFSIDFSPFAGFYVESYNGPGIPQQRLIKVDDTNYSNILTSNSYLAEIDSTYRKAITNYTTYTLPTGEELNVLLLQPPNFDHRKQYPLLVSVYGGPGAQKVNTAFTRDWHSYLCTNLEYIILTIDPRGTGFKGRSFRMGTRENLGHLEAQDVVEVTKYYSSLSWVDSKKVGIWGWSYGGYLTLKVIELGSGVFTLGMAVAPVVDWAFYDSIYTERYMSTPQLNPAGYHNSSVHSMEGFRNIDFALAHGSGDDNVHFLNSASLLDKLTGAHIRDFRFRMFTDSSHSIQMRGSYWELHHWLTNFMIEKWGQTKEVKLVDQ